METLSLNKETGKYEAIIVIEVEAEFFQRAFFRYVEENGIDLTDITKMQQAIADVSSAARWINHPRTIKRLDSPHPEKKRIGRSHKVRKEDDERVEAIAEAVNGIRFR